MIRVSHFASSLIARYLAVRRPVRGAEQLLLHPRAPVVQYFVSRGAQQRVPLTAQFFIRVDAASRVARQWTGTTESAEGRLTTHRTFEFLRRTERVESVLTRENFAPFAAAGFGSGARPVARQVLRTVRLPITAAPTPQSTWSNGSGDVSHIAPAAGGKPQASFEIERLTDQVVRAIDRRMVAMKERFGKF